MNLNKIKKLIDKMAKAKAEIKKSVKEALKEAFQEFFTAVPEAKCVKWNQSIPSFNDGDVCGFSVHEPNLFLTQKGWQSFLVRSLPSRHMMIV